MPEMKPALVLVRGDRLGDVVVSSSILEPILKRYGQTHEIIWSVKKEYLPLFAGLGGVKSVAMEELPGFLEGKPPGTAIFLNPAPVLECRWRALGEFYGWGKTLPDERKKCRIPEIQELANLLKASGFPIYESSQPWIAPLQPLPIVNLPQKPYVIIHISAFEQKPTLTAKTILGLTDDLQKMGNSVVWVGLENRRDSDWLGEMSGGLKVIAFEKLSILELYAVLKSAKGVIGRDSGVTHLSAAIGIPTVAVVGPLAKVKAAARWSPMGPCSRALEFDIAPRFWEGYLSYQKRYFESVKPKDVVEELKTLWRCQTATESQE